MKWALQMNNDTTTMIMKYTPGWISLMCNEQITLKQLEIILSFQNYLSMLSILTEMEKIAVKDGAGGASTEHMVSRKLVN